MDMQDVDFERKYENGREEADPLIFCQDTLCQSLVTTALRRL